MVFRGSILHWYDPTVSLGLTLLICFQGSIQAPHPVGASRLPQTHRLSGLADVSVSPGRELAASAQVHLGMKDQPNYMARGYIPTLKWLSKKFILMWDEESKRGWLVNGTSALLHLVFASLRHNSSDRFKASFEFNFGDVQDPPNPLNADSAIDVLLDPKNKSLRIYPENDGHITFRDRIEYFCNILEKLVDYQIRPESQPEGLPRKYLAGWDFRELATEQDPIYPRVARLRTKGKGWVDFIRAVNAVTLIGRGFGSLIRPSETSICEFWTELPEHKYYIAACLHDLKELTENYSHPGSKVVKLSDNIIWHNPNSDFKLCKCKGVLSKEHIDLVQVLLPSSLSRFILPRKGSITMEETGAVIFGQNSLFNWFWRDSGEPREGSRELLSEDSEEDDLEIGHDIASTTSLSSKRRADRSNSSLRLKSVFSHTELQSENTTSWSGTSFEDDVANRMRYRTAILCALSKELLAVRALFDKKHTPITVAQEDDNHYEFGEIGSHYVVACSLAAGETGTNAAAAAASAMKTNFPSIRCCLLVGIAGGVPSEAHDIRLGDVVVSSPRGIYPGIVQYDLGKALENSVFEPTGSLQRTPRFMMSAISSLMSDPDLGSEPLLEYLEEIKRRNPAYSHPGHKKRKRAYGKQAQELDQLFSSAACAKCVTREKCPHREERLVRRDSRTSDHPVIHYGLIASGNQVIKDAKTRDVLSQRYRDVLCFEMEAAGIMNIFPCLVVRGICDYADSHKSDLWQEYAAATAAAYAKLFLSFLKNDTQNTPQRTFSSPRAVSTISSANNLHPNRSKPAFMLWSTENPH
jgi:nucleoside phosphorylase